MGRFVEIGYTSDLQDGEMRDISVEGKRLLLARVGDEYFAVENRCPHMGATLTEGKLEHFVVTCPRHGSQFDLRDGHVMRWTNLPSPVAAISKIIKRPRPLGTFRVKAEGDSLQVDV